MNKTLEEGLVLADQIAQAVEESQNDVLAVIAPPHTHLSGVYLKLKEVEGLELSAQNCHEQTEGAYTGEVSAKMIASVGAKYVIVGHSERRQYFAESNELLIEKVNAVIANKLTPIFCIGENLTERDTDEYFNVIKKQLGDSLFHLQANDFSDLVIAYEPVWAIGTGNTASTDQVQEIHHFIRSTISKQYGDEVASRIPILYGGSCNPKNAKSIFACDDVDGGLIGGASLKSEDFIAIINSF